MKLMFLPANQRWVFVMGTVLVRFYNKQDEPEELFLMTRSEGVRMAKRYGLHVDKYNNVTVEEE